MGKFTSTKVIPLGSCAFRQPTAESHCRFIHGYRLQAKFWFTCNELDKNNWVVDFGGLKPLKAELEQTFDHKTVVSIKDPQLEIFKMLELQGIVELVIMENGVGIERFAEFCFNAANEFIKNTTEGRCWCSKVEVWEHPENSAIYEI
jgi:6-pyruvoyltetrahydropterin/6-carboxytetrahydropterin synthase